MTGTGYFPLGRDQAYEMSNEDPPKYLVGTSEVSLTAFHMNETLELKSLPKKYKPEQIMSPIIFMKYMPRIVMLL